MKKVILGFALFCLISVVHAEVYTKQSIRMEVQPDQIHSNFIITNHTVASSAKRIDSCANVANILLNQFPDSAQNSETSHAINELLDIKKTFDNYVSAGNEEKAVDIYFKYFLSSLDNDTHTDLPGTVDCNLVIRVAKQALHR